MRQGPHHSMPILVLVILLLLMVSALLHPQVAAAP
jgi:hypothetical protein